MYVYLYNLNSKTINWGNIDIPVFDVVQQCLDNTFGQNLFDIWCIELYESVEIVREFQKYQVKTPS